MEGVATKKTYRIPENHHLLPRGQFPTSIKRLTSPWLRFVCVFLLALRNRPNAVPSLARRPRVTFSRTLFIIDKDSQFLASLRLRSSCCSRSSCSSHRVP